MTIDTNAGEFDVANEGVNTDDNETTWHTELKCSMPVKFRVKLHTGRAYLIDFKC